MRKIFVQTIESITQKFKYTRYMPLLYYKGNLTQPEELAQRNMGKFMKILLIKRLESSFYAFNNSLNRFIASYESFIKEYKKGNVYISKKHPNDTILTVSKKIPTRFLSIWKRIMMMQLNI